MTNAVLRPYRVWVCRPGEDETTGFEVTQWCTGESGGFLTLSSEPIDTEGILHYSGQLTLAVPPYDDRFDPWLSPDRWKIGNFVRMQVADTSGDVRALPINHLYIINDPKPPYPGNWQIDLELGDRYRLQDRQTVPPLPEGTATRGELVSALLRLPPESSLSIPGRTLTGYLPSPGQSATAAAGELAIGKRKVLIQTATGEAGLRGIDLYPDTPLFTHTVGQDDAGEFEPLQALVRPASEVRVSSPVSAVDDDDGGGGSGGSGGSGGGSGGGGSGGGGGGGSGGTDARRGSRTTPIRMLASAIAPELSDNEITAGTRTESWFWSGDNRYEETSVEQLARGLVVGNDVYQSLDEARGTTTIPIGPTVIIPNTTQTKVQIYEGGKSGRLLVETVRVTAPRGAVFGDLIKKTASLFANVAGLNLLTPIVIEEAETRYSYNRIDGTDSGGQVRQVRTVTKRAIGQIAASGNDWLTRFANGSALLSYASLLQVAEIKQQNWYQRGMDRWEQHEQTWQAGQAKGGKIDGFLRLVRTQDDSQVSSSGDTLPPPADRRLAKNAGDTDRENSKTPKPPEFELEFDDGAIRLDGYDINHLESEGDAAQLGILLGTIEQSRARGFRIVSALRDEWFDWEPFSRIDLIYNGARWVGVTDLVSFVLAGNSITVLVDCMRTARFSEGRITPINPARLRINQEFTFESVFVFLPEGAIDKPVSPLIVDSAFSTNFEKAAFQSFLFESVFEAVGGAGDLDLVAYWKLEGSPWADELNGFTLTAITGTATAVAGYDGNGMRLNTSLTRFTAPLNSILDFGDVDWAVSFWVRYPATNAARTLARSRTDDGDTEWVLRDTIVGTEWVVIGTLNGASGAIAEVTVSTGIAASAISNDWHFIELKYLQSSSTLSLKVDALESSAGASGTPVKFSGARLQIGGIATANVIFDELKVFK